MGKHKPIYDPAGGYSSLFRYIYSYFTADCGDYVVVKNATKVLTTGDKANQIVYRNHTTYPGGLKEISFNRLKATKPDEIIRKAVSGMLPKNRTRKHLLDRLLIFNDETLPDSINGNITKDYLSGDKVLPQADKGWKAIGGRRGPEGGPRWHKSSFGRA